jgi:hypothetical protein
MLFAVTATLVIIVLIHIGVRVIVNSDTPYARTRTSINRLKLPADYPTDLDGYNYVVEFGYPNGRVLRVLVPVDSDVWDRNYERVYGGPDEPFGLNLVCPGHYT